MSSRRQFSWSVALTFQKLILFSLEFVPFQFLVTVMFPKGSSCVPVTGLSRCRLAVTWMPGEQTWLCRKPAQASPPTQATATSAHLIPPHPWGVLLFHCLRQQQADQNFLFFNHSCSSSFSLSMLFLNSDLT